MVMTRREGTASSEPLPDWLVDTVARLALRAGISSGEATRLLLLRGVHAYEEHERTQRDAA